MAAGSTGRVRVEPRGVEFHVDVDESVMAAAQRQNYTWPTICQGMGDCSACYVRVIDGGSSVNEMSDAELVTLKSLYFRNPSARAGEFRLACQMLVHGAVTVFKRGVRRRTSGACICSM